MERFFIQVENGQPVDYPILESNFRSAFPNIDPNNLPDNFAEFERVEEPSPGLYQKNTYECVSNGSGGFRDSWTTIDMTEEEKQDLINGIKANWEQMNGPASWVFNEELCRFLPPVPFPDDFDHVITYTWDEENQTWEREPM